ncbi:glycoside hydrolase family 3 N-terminal domain-containing protein [Fulvivirgaceae bacterium BMA12]|uniref:beta-glucosidase n=1 Tax=Agaribacillus aureus TaxID=3051825 RepID=A0ABT8L8C1_9BACT|nr:glycoside hydrolase family 3 N-terminal domain-containing protein [Fulvivirgaceae bacterium BMA12]
MRKTLKILGFTAGGVVVLILLLWAGFEINYQVINAKARSRLTEKQLLNIEGKKMRDLNGNGKLDIYEDFRKPVDERIADLLAQMNLEEKAGLMWQPPLGVGELGEVLGKPDPTVFNMASSYDYLINKKLRTFNLFTIPAPEHLARWHNEIQKIAEQDRLGIPVTISSDPRHGINNFIGGGLLNGDFSEWPEPLGLAATNDSSLVFEFGRIAAQEFAAVGIRAALHPMADLATEPRWARINGTFGEDADLSAKMTAAYIYGFQGAQLGPQSVACMTKHWPGGGPQDDGQDAHFRYGMDQAYPGDHFDYHLIPFKAAIEAGTAMMMPYYGIPVNQTSENVGMAFNKEIIHDLLREQYGYDGIVCTDWGIIEGFGLLGFEMFEGQSWGVDELSIKGKIKKAIEAGVDQFGGNSNTEELIALVHEGLVAEARIDQSVRRILRVKFQMGLFDNPYVDVNVAREIVGKQAYMDLGKLAQRKSIVLLKNKMNRDSTMTLPFSGNINIYIENIDKEVAGKYANVVDSLQRADIAILRLQTPWEPRDGNFIESFFHQGYLDFKEPELSRVLDIAASKPTIISLYLDRPAVIPEIANEVAGLLGEFGARDEAVLDVVFGAFNPTAKLPFELPASMEEVAAQMEDVPYDTKDPVFPFGFGLSYEIK